MLALQPVIPQNADIGLELGLGEVRVYVLLYADHIGAAA